jgi:hypothetical protein
MVIMDFRCAIQRGTLVDPPYPCVGVRSSLSLPRNWPRMVVTLSPRGPRCEFYSKAGY